jgi:hypothetical protein
LTIFFLFPFFAYCQVLKYSNSTKHELKYLDSSYFKINKNIFRITATLPLEDLGNYVPDVMIMGNYEHRLYKNISLVGNLGIRMCNKSTGIFFAEPVSSFHVTGTGEMRYYYAMLKRERNLRPTINFSGGYVSLCQYVLAKPFAVASRNKQVTEKDAIQSQSDLYFNTGYQRQYKKLYLNMFIGVLILNETNNLTNDLRYGSLPAGVTLGYVF